LDIETLRSTHPDHWAMATALRVLALDAVAAANSGHSGMPMGMADIATVLFTRHLRFDPKTPHWPDRDRFILSNGHGSMLLYGLLHLTGYEDMPLDELRAFRQWGSRTAGHPEYGYADGIETTTGPLGQGLANSVGFAMAEEMLRARWGAKIVDHHTYVFAGDGCLMEGVSHEAIALAGRQKLSKLILFFDDNGITIDGKVSLSDITDQRKRFEASGWDTFACDGHDPEDIDRAIVAAKASPGPAMIACRTHIALGSSAQDTAKGHGALTDATLVSDTRAAYGWKHGAFEIPEDIRHQWREVGARGAEARAAWEERLAALSPARQGEFARCQNREAPRKLAGTIRALKRQLADQRPKVATRKASEMVLEVLNPILPETVGGSADLTGSNNTKTGDLGVFTPEDRKGRYVYYGIREHGMAAAMNGLALHGGLRPYGGTFLVFSDYARGAIRLSALMGQPVVYVLTHDSIGLGEDGPTHQPIEHLAMLRATPNMRVIRPADAIETAEAWEVALATTDRPTVLALTRQNLPTVCTAGSANQVAKGAYILAEAEGKRRAILLATGSEVEIALEARALLQADGIGTRVVSMPSWELFEEQSDSYRRRVLPPGSVRVAVEAASRFGWDRWLCGEGGRREKSAFVGMKGFGASAPYERLYAEFGITAEAVAGKARDLLGG
jgi:transketolase